MKLLYIILYHKNPDQLFRLINALNDKNNQFILHICTSVNEGDFKIIKEKFSGFPNIHFCKRIRVVWGTGRLTEAMVNAMKHSIQIDIDYKYVSVLSGQDFPIKSNEFISNYFKENYGKQFLNYWDMAPLVGKDEPYYHPIRQEKFTNRETSKFENRIYCYKGLFKIRLPGIIIPNPKSYRDIIANIVKFMLRVIIGKRKFLRGIHPYGGSDWYSITKDCVQYIIAVYDNNIKLTNFMKTVRSSSEMYFHTVLLNSEYKTTLTGDNLRFISWPDDSAHPKILTMSDWKPICESPALFARKFDEKVDKAIMDKIEAETL